MVKVMIFDSGVGGLSVCDAVMKKCPDVQITFACDNEGFPYGTKNEADLVERVEIVLTDLITKHAPNLLVVACNTASTVALPKIRNKFTLPIVGVVPAIKPAAKISKTKIIGLLATPATVNRLYTQELINEFANNCQIIRVGSSELVQIAEDKMRGKEVDVLAIKKILEPFFIANRLDTIILACTHFPLLKEDLRAALPFEVTWVDSGEAIATRVNDLLAQTLSSRAQRGDLPKHFAVFTKMDESVLKLKSELGKMGFKF